MDGESIVAIIFVLLGFALLIWFLCIPGSIAKKKGHQHATAVGILGVVGGLFFFIGWFIALAWAFMMPDQASEALRQVKANPDIADELAKLKKLETEGILTAAEFNFKKTQLIGPIAG